MEVESQPSSKASWVPLRVKDLGGKSNLLKDFKCKTSRSTQGPISTLISSLVLDYGNGMDGGLAVHPLFSIQALASNSIVRSSWGPSIDIS